MMHRQCWARRLNAGGSDRFEKSSEIYDITLHEFEQRITYQAEQILTWWRYRDDILVIYHGTTEDFQHLIEQLNRMHPTLKFTYEASNISINYLDLTIFKSKSFQTTGILDTKVYRKPTETYQYLHRKSSHPPHVFNAFIYGECLRYARNTNNLEDFRKTVQNFSRKLLNRGYSQQEIELATSKISLEGRTQLVHKPQKGTRTKKLPVVFSTTYNPAVNHRDLKRAICKHWRHIQSNEQLREIFPNPPLIAYRKARNIREMIVRAKLPKQTPVPDDSGFVEEPDETLDILLSLLEEQVTHD